MRRYLPSLGSALTVIGLIGLAYTIAPLANAVAHPAQSPAPLSWGLRDFITLLTTLLIAMAGAFFSGAKKELERMVAANAAQILDLRQAVSSQARDHNQLTQLLLREYSNKEDVGERIEHAVEVLSRDIAGVVRRLDAMSSGMPFGSRHQ